MDFVVCEGDLCGQWKICLSILSFFCKCTGRFVLLITGSSTNVVFFSSFLVGEGDCNPMCRFSDLAVVSMNLGSKTATTGTTTVLAKDACSGVNQVVPYQVRIYP